MNRADFDSKVCPLCGELKGREEYVSKSGGTVYWECRACHRLRYRKIMRERVVVEREDFVMYLKDACGGKCMVCDWDASVRSLVFVSREPGGFSDQVTRYIRGGALSAWNRLMRWLHKGVLVCPNCASMIALGEIQVSTFTVKQMGGHVNALEPIEVPEKVKP